MVEASGSSEADCDKGAEVFALCLINIRMQEIYAFIIHV